jgi:hypothetical protein
MRIAILLHERTREYARDRRYTVWELEDIWREAGHGVEAVYGVDEEYLAGFDVVIQHVDLTVVPPDHRYEGTGSQIVLNRHCYDISKSGISDLGIRSPDGPAPEGWDGPVIVKTECNHGGRPEADNRSASRWRRELRRLLRNSRFRFRFDVDLDPHRYPVFDSVREVPRAVWSNPSLVVERFMPERVGESYSIRWCLFLGDRATSFRLLSNKPIVKASSGSAEPVPVPDDLTAMRERIGLDYGRFDYVVHDGKSYILDVSRTPAGMPAQADRRAAAEKIAPGFDALVAAARGS